MTAFAAQPPAVATTLYTTGSIPSCDQGHHRQRQGVDDAGAAPPKGAQSQIAAGELHARPSPSRRRAPSDLIVGDGYGCALRNQAPKLNATPCRRRHQHRLGTSAFLRAASAGARRGDGPDLQRALNIPAGLLASGGFVYFTLDASVAGNPWVADWKLNPDTVKSYAARLPALASAATEPATLRRPIAADRGDAAEQSHRGAVRGRRIRRRLRANRPFQPAHDDRRGNPRYRSNSRPEPTPASRSAGR